MISKSSNSDIIFCTCSHMSACVLISQTYTHTHTHKITRVKNCNFLNEGGYLRCASNATSKIVSLNKMKEKKERTKTIKERFHCLRKSWNHWYFLLLFLPPSFRTPRAEIKFHRTLLPLLFLRNFFLHHDDESFERKRRREREEKNCIHRGKCINYL